MDAKRQLRYNSSLLNLWETVRPPAGGTFPYLLEKLCVFTWLRGGIGQVDCHVEVVQASSGYLVRRAGPNRLPFGARVQTVYALFRIERVVFPSPGQYFVEFYCDGRFLDDQVIGVLPS